MDVPVVGPQRLGSFIEINVRSYVVDALDRRSVWFFSRDVSRSAIVAVARTVFSLPYCWAHAEHVVDGSAHRYRMTRRWPRGSSPRAEMSFRVADRPPDDEATDLDHFLWPLQAEARTASRPIVAASR